MGHGDGDCESDADCATGLVCGEDNCGHFRDTKGWPHDSDYSWDTTDDCCYNPVCCKMCSDDWCESPDGQGGNDCYAGAWNEPCDCSKGDARLTGESGEYGGNTYYEYTCCTQGSTVGRECGDYNDGHFYGVVVGVSIAIAIVGFLCLVCCRKRIVKGSRVNVDAK